MTSLQPSKHMSLFQRRNNVTDVQTTLYQRQNDVVCLLKMSRFMVNYGYECVHTLNKM